MCKKVCSKCGEEKSLEEYYMDKKSKDGYRSVCMKCNSEHNKDYLKKNKEKLKKYWSSKYFENRDYILERKKKYNEKNKEKINIYRDIYKKRRNELRSKRKKEDNIFYIIEKVRVRLYIFLKSRNITKRNQTFSIVGCTPEELKFHLEKQFKDGMSWDNKHLWHIDHRTPLSSAKTEEEIYKLCHYTNLQPLWAEENMKKGSKIINQNE